RSDDMRHPATHIAPPRGKLGVLLVGLGAVSTTFIAGVHAVRKGLAPPIGSLTQLGTIRLGKRTEHRSPLINEFVPLAKLDDLVFGAWDIFEDDAYQSALTAGVLEKSLLEQLRPELEAIVPWPAVFDRHYVRRLDGPNVKPGTCKRELVSALRADIRTFARERGVERMVMLWCGSTEAFMTPGPAHASMAAFERALDADDPAISPSMLYAYAAITEGIPYANAAPNLCVDTAAFLELANEHHVPVAGKDLKTGQTLLKTIIAPGLKARMLGVKGWYSTNILGNRDGEVLEDPASFRTKEVSKKGVLDYILQPDLYPALYGELCHMVHINYYPPRGDNKEGWDNIDLIGWLNYPMQLKINFLCRDSILAAPLVLDLALFLDLAQRAGRTGIQEWLSFYFKSPMYAPGLYPEHDLSIQLKKLKNTLRHLRGEELVTHLGIEYYP
ncbi:MAG TPA: inositol-3-phosphate synthase, partial [Steroidobacteraceae bacterium]|nr:inositol-3-phosphate synthase [Steroidobacteraceae bacterium]